MVVVEDAKTPQEQSSVSLIITSLFFENGNGCEREQERRRAPVSRLLSGKLD